MEFSNGMREIYNAFSVYVKRFVHIIERKIFQFPNDAMPSSFFRPSFWNAILMRSNAA